LTDGFWLVRRFPASLRTAFQLAQCVKRSESGKAGMHGPASKRRTTYAWRCQNRTARPGGP
jgi:hypothetical protein